jgi:hypothetical protein
MRFDGDAIIVMVMRYNCDGDAMVMVMRCDFIIAMRCEIVVMATRCDAMRCDYGDGDAMVMRW